MIYVVTQDGLNNYPVEDEDIIRTIVTKIGENRYHVTLDRTNTFNDKPYIALGDYADEKTAVNVIREIANRRALCVNFDSCWNACYFMPKEEEDVGEN